MGTLTAACNSSAPAEVAPTVRQELTGTGVGNPDRIDKLQIAMLEEELPQGNARVLATVSPHFRDTHKQGFFTLKPNPADPSQDVRLNDQGKDGDEKAGDRIFSGIVKFDFGEFQAQNKRIDALGGPSKVSVVPFRGRIAGPRRPVKLVPEILPGVLIDATPLGLGDAISVPASLTINHPSVVTDPTRTFDRCSGTGTQMGAWTFGNLWKNMVNQPLTGADPSDVAIDWMKSWLVNQEIHFNTALPRPAMANVINDWVTASGGSQADLGIAPFRLVAIVNRIDLHSSVGYSVGSAGETRFVFALEDSNCNPMPFLVIFEYGNTSNGCFGLRDLAQRWIDLEPHLGTPTYNNLLQDITDTVTLANADPSRPSGSALNQLRTNEIALAGPWELREFIVDPGGSGFLKPETVKRNPDISLNLTPQLAFAIDSNLPTVWPNPPASMPNILTGSFDPIEFPAGTPIRAMAAVVNHPGECFEAPIAGNSAISAVDARFEYSSNTCTGCHGGDVNQLGSFTHIDEHGNLSPFMSGPYSQGDCSVPSLTRSFDEPLRRAQVLDTLANNSCMRLAAMTTLQAEH